MTEQAQTAAANESTGTQTAVTTSTGQGTQQKAAAQGGSGPGHTDHDHDGDCLRICGARELPTADHDLELDHIDLEAALHGPSTTRGRRSYNWNRSNEVTRTFDSIARLLNQTVPPDRDSIDAQRINAAKKAGS